MSTEDEKNARDVQNLLSPDHPCDSDNMATDEAFARMEGELNACKRKHMEERFCWMVLVVILFDSFLFEECKTWTTPVMISSFELVVILVIARHLGITVIENFIYRVVDGYFGQKGEN